MRRELTTTDFEFDVGHRGRVTMTFGAASISMPMDSAFDFQHQLAEFLARLEICEYPDPSADETESVKLGREFLGFLNFKPD
jgi:hypothetical protein